MGGAITGFLKLIFKQFRLFFERLMVFIFGKSKNENGKIRFFQNSKSMVRFFTVFSLITVSLYLVYKFVTDKETFVDSRKAYDSEIVRPSTVNTIDDERKSRFIDPLADIKPTQFGGSASSILQNAQDTSFTESGLDFERCSELMNKFRTFNNLTKREKKELEECLKNQDMFSTLTPEERNALIKSLEEQVLSEEEKRLIEELFGEEASCKEEFNEQSTSDEGKFFLSKLLQDDELNLLAIDLIKNKDTLIDSKIKDQLGFSDEEVIFFKNLLEKCSTNLLIKMLSNDKIKNALIKVLESSRGLEEALNQEDLSDEERRILQDKAQGNTTLGTADDAIADALISTDKKKKALAKSIMKAREMGDEEIEDALTKKLLGEDLTDEEKKRIDRFDPELYDEAYNDYKKGDERAAALKSKQAQGGKLTPEEKAELVSDLQVNKEKSFKEIVDQIAKDLNKKDELDRAVQEAQLKAAEAANKVNKGFDLSKADQELLKRLTDLLDERSRLEQRIAENDAIAAAELERKRLEYEKSRKTFKVVRGNSQVLLDIEEKICSTHVKPYQITKRKKKRRARKKKTYAYDGKKLTSDEIEIYELLKKSKAKVANLNKDLFKSVGSIKYSGQKIVASRVEGNVSKIEQSFLIKNSVGREIKLSRSQKIAAVMTTSIHTTKGGASVRLQYRILHDVYDPVTKTKVIPSGSIAHGPSGSFDAKTGIMQLSSNTVTIGGKDVDLAFDIGSGDATIGLKGEVYDQNFQKIAGSLVAAFTAGAINAVQTAYIDPFNDSDDISDLMSGATLGGLSEVSNQILQDVANDLQNSPEIFWVPSNIPVVLYPK